MLVGLLGSLILASLIRFVASTNHFGLKQAPRAWFQRFASFIASVGFIGSKSGSSLFVYRRGADMDYLLLYVDDIIMTSSSSTLLHSLIASLRTEFSMADMGNLHYFLGISV